MTEAYDNVANAADLARLNGFLDGLVGKPCWNLGFSYGDEFYLEFGAKLVRSSAPMAGWLYGEWELGTRASPWVLLRADGSEIASDKTEPEEAKARFSEVIDRHVASASVSLRDLDLLIEFDDDGRLEVKCCQDPDEEDDDDTELACWELLMPGSRILEVWPGQRWIVQPYERA